MNVVFLIICSFGELTNRIRERFAKQGDSALGSVCPFVHLSAPPANSNQSHYQSKLLVCNRGAYTDNSADAVNRLSII